MYKIVPNFIGVISIVALLLLLGKYFHWSIRWCVFAVVLTIIVFVAIHLLRWLWVRYKGKQLQKSLHAQNNSIAGHQLESELLKEKMLVALENLKGSELGRRYRGASALYVLPWFMVIGPSAAGKSTLIRGSGLNFPQATHQELQLTGCGGTRNCDWWFSDEAVLLDTAGRYTTETTDHNEWLDFLKLLRKYRPRLPINGIIVAISLPEILLASDGDLATHAKIIRSRINELYTTLELIFPVTVVITKCDLLSGFVEYFAEMSSSEREQLCGISLTGDAHDQLSILIQKLRALIINKLSLERNLQRKCAIINFPLQFESAAPYLEEFIGLLLRENPYQETPVYSGLYFTSGTQEGIPLQRLLDSFKSEFKSSSKENATVASEKVIIQRHHVIPDANEHVRDLPFSRSRTLSLSKLASSPKQVKFRDDAEQLRDQKSYFIANLFSKVVFANQNRVAASKKRLRIIKVWQSSVVLLGAALIVAIFIAYSVSYRSNVALLKYGEKDIFSISKHSSFTNLQNSFAYYQRLLGYQNSRPFYFRLGLYRGDQLIPLWRHILIRGLRWQFAPSVGRYLEKQLRNYQHLWLYADAAKRELLRGEYYGYLRSYLMLAYPQRMDFILQPTIFAHYLLHLTGADIKDNSNYLAMVTLYLHHLHPLPINRQLVERARTQLAGVSQARNLYAMLRYALGNTVKPLSVSTQLLSSSYQLPGIYSKRSWIKLVQPLIKKISAQECSGDWVMTDSFDRLAVHNSHIRCNHDGLNLHSAIERLYFQDYHQAWFNFLINVRVNRFSSLAETNQQLPKLAAKQGALVSLFAVFTKNLDLPQFKLLSHQIAKILNSGLPAYLQQLLKVRADLQQLIAVSEQSSASVNFTAQLLGGSGGKSELYRTMVAANLLVDGLSDDKLKHAVLSFLYQPLRQVWSAVLVDAAKELQLQWQQQILGFFQQNIADRFPLDRYATDSVSLSDLDHLFNHNSGLLWDFINHKLNPFVQFNQNGWQIRKWLNVGLQFAPSFLKAIVQLRDITNALYSVNHQLGFRYWIYPIPTKGLSQITVTANGQSYSYRNGPQEWLAMRWPVNNLQQNSYFAVVTEPGIPLQSAQEVGVWGFLRLLATARMQKMSGSTVRFSLQVKSDRYNFPLRFLLRTDGVHNLFYQLLTHQLSLPEQMFL